MNIPWAMTDMLRMLAGLSALVLIPLILAWICCDIYPSTPAVGLPLVSKSIATMEKNYHLRFLPL